jgi:hypothetical protein
MADETIHTFSNLTRQDRQITDGTLTLLVAIVLFKLRGGIHRKNLVRIARSWEKTLQLLEQNWRECEGSIKIE